MYRILEGDVTEQLKTLADASVDSIVTDPPYGLEFMGKDWDAPWKSYRRQGFDGNIQLPDNPQGRCKVRNGNGRSYGADKHLMQVLQKWHYSWAVEALRVLKPGGYLLAFGGSRTYHRLACAIEDAGFEIRDQIMWIYGSGFPKSLDVSKAIDKDAGAERKVVRVNRNGSGPNLTKLANHGVGDTGIGYMDGSGKVFNVTAPATDAAKQWTGWGTALKPAHEPIVVARKPLVGTVAANVLQYGTGAMNIDACRVEYEDTMNPASNPLYRVQNNYQTKVGSDSNGTSFSIKPNGGYVTANDLGRWPANVIHDGSNEVLAAFPNAPGQLADVKFDPEERKTQNAYGVMKRGHEPSANRSYVDNGSTNFAMKPGARRLDQGTAARFFYCAKASREERNRGCELLGKKPLLWSSGTQSPGTFQSEGTDRTAQNNHPTVKPVALMAYLCRLVTPPHGTVLDLFMGSGSTGIAALREGLNFIGIERNAEYVEIARARIEADAPLFNKSTNDEES